MHMLRRRLSVEAGEDGDFVQLRIIRTQRKKEREAQSLPKTSENQHKLDNNEQNHNSIPKLFLPTQAEDVAEEIFNAIDQKDTDMIQKLLHEIRKTTGLHVIKHPTTDENIFHRILARGLTDMATVLIRSESDELILSDHRVNFSGVQGQRNGLHIATEIGAIKIAKLILDKLPNEEKRMKMMILETAVDIQGQRPRLFSCLHLAAYHGHTELVRLYLDYGMPVNHLNGKKDTALLWAARWGHDETIKLLLDRNADPEIKNDKGSTALYWAVRYQYPKTVSLLLEQGKANPNTTRKVGLVAPLIVASAYGSTEIVGILLRHENIDVNVKIRGGDTAIHYAAREGYQDVLKLLIKHGAHIDDPDEIGDTPLLLAAKNGHASIVQTLIRKCADLNKRNYEGLDIWYFAIENEGIGLLEQMVTGNNPIDFKRRNPLCIAASAGRCDKVKFLLDAKFDPGSGDIDGNTFLHHAAMTDKHEVIDNFNTRQSINVKNLKGNTPLHIACLNGYSSTIASLLNCKAKVDIKNNKGETALHAAALSQNISAETVRQLVDYTVKTHEWECLNEKDFSGNNALHQAVQFLRPEVIWEFRSLRITDKNNDGLTPLHKAVRAEKPEVLDLMLDIFVSKKREGSINEQSCSTNETVLHLAADAGHTNCVKRLIDLGADISIKDSNGNTVMHRMVENCALKSCNSSVYMTTFDTILDNILKWWCINRNSTIPDNLNDETTLEYKREAIAYITSEVRNNEGLSVINLAFKLCVPEVIRRLLLIPDVTMFEDKVMTFDVTGLTPWTNNMVHGCCGSTRVTPLKQPRFEDQTTDAEDKLNVSGIEYLISDQEKGRISEILDIPPVKMIENYYTSMVAWTFATFIVCHVIYMSVFTYVSLELLTALRVDNSTFLKSSDSMTILLYAFVPLEPAIIVLYAIYTLVTYFITGDVNRISKLSTKHGWNVIVSDIGSHMLTITCVVFAGLVFAWIGLFTTRYRFQDYILAAALCIGWLLTISFTRGIRMIHYFYRMLLSIIIRDMLRFVVVYMCVLLAFGFALHALFQESNDIALLYSTPGSTLFLTFNMMIGMATLFDESFETNMEAAERSSLYPKVIYLIYVILATIILLNVLIAMMNDSYSMVLQQKQEQWRIESVYLGLAIESTLPIIKLLSSVKIRMGDTDDSTFKMTRWYLSMTEPEYIQCMQTMEKNSQASSNALSKHLDDIESKLTQTMRQISETVQNLSNQIEKCNYQRKRRHVSKTKLKSTTY